MLKVTPNSGKRQFSGWENTPPEKRNVFQRVAAWSDGWLTPANVITGTSQGAALSGIALAASGRTMLGAALFVGARVGDFVDGKVAHVTKTQSDKGEALDVGGDKLQILVGGIALAVAGLYPVEAAVPTISTQIAISAYGVQAARRKQELHPGVMGKFNMGAATGGVASFMTARALEVSHPVVSEAFKSIGGYGLTASSIVFATTTLVDYHRQLHAPDISATPSNLK